MLIAGLPYDSLTARTLAGTNEGPLAAWSLSELLLGRLIDEVAVGRWQWESVHAKRGSSNPRPKSVLPQLDRHGLPHQPHQRDADVIPIVSPHRLGGFMHDDEQEGA